MTAHSLNKIVKFSQLDFRIWRLDPANDDSFIVCDEISMSE